MRKLIMIYFSIFALVVSSSAQKKRSIDSLENILSTQELPPSRKLGIYDTICRLSIYFDLEKLMMYSDKGLSLAKKENNKLMTLSFNENYAIAYVLKTSYDTALVYYEQALDLALEIKNKEQEGSIYEGMAITYWQQQKQVLSLEYFLKALAIFEVIGDKQRSMTIFGNLSSMHRELKNYDKAIYYSEKSKTLAEELNDSYKSILADYNLGNIYLDKKEYEKALDYTQKALERSRTYEDPYLQMISLQTLSNIYSYGFNNYSKALEYLNESVQVGNEYGNWEVSYSSLSLMSDIYRKQKQWKGSEDAALKALAIDSTSMDGYFGIVTNIILSNIHLGNEDKAESFFWKYDAMKNKYIDKNYRETMLDMEAKYETEKKEMRITTLENERKLYIGLGIAVAAVLLLGLGLLFYRHRLSVQKQKMAEQQIRQLEQEKELIAARSALDAEKAEREIIARDLHDGVGAMLSVVKNNMNIVKSYSFVENREADYFNKALDGLEKTIVELRRVAHHIMPAILVENGLVAALDDLCRSIPEAEFHCSKSELRFDPEKELVLYRCAYELVNNVLRHANASHIDVHFNTDDDTAYLSVVDNGCGFDLQATPQGMGINNMRTRLTVFGGSIEIFSEPGKGTEANVELKM